MISKEENQFKITDESAKWVAVHPVEGINGPLSLTFKKDELLTECCGYSGTLSEKNAVSRKIKDYHKAGEAFLEAEGFLPGGEGRVEYKHTYRYSNRRMRITTDFRFYNFSIERHFAEGSLFLPGKWKKFFCRPSANLKIYGAKDFSRDIPAYEGKTVMLGHWHRPPLSVTFFRPNGTALEIGTGSDIWRWEENLGYSPESGSYKIILEESGLRFIREPLACCESFSPDIRPFRYSWYMAWRENGALKKLPNHQKVTIDCDNQGNPGLSILKSQIEKKTLYVYAVIDFKRVFKGRTENLRTDSPYDYIRDIQSENVCWSNKSIVTAAKKIIRKLTEVEGLDGIIFKNIEPDICYNASHVNKKHENGTAHWDINGIFDFASWTKNHCDGKLDLYVDSENVELPSITGLFE